MFQHRLIVMDESTESFQHHTATFNFEFVDFSRSKRLENYSRARHITRNRIETAEHKVQKRLERKAEHFILFDGDSPVCSPCLPQRTSRQRFPQGPDRCIVGCAAAMRAIDFIHFNISRITCAHKLLKCVNSIAQCVANFA